MRHILILSFLMSLAACGAKKQVDEMHDKTVQMAKTTEDLKEQTVETKDLLGWVAFLQKQGDGFGIRQDAFASMNAAKTLNMKLKQATAYYWAFEFQVVSFAGITGVDVKEVRDILASKAVSELGKTVPELLPEGTKWSLNATDSGSKHMSVMALAATLHEINPFQTAQVEQVGLGAVSMLDLLMGSLLKKEKLNAGIITRESLSILDKEVLREEQLFVHLLKMRFKTLPAIALGRISRVKDGFLSQLGMMFIGKWTPHFAFDGDMNPTPAVSERENSTRVSNLNLEQIHFAAEIIEEALKTRSMLKRLNASLKLDKDIEKLYKKMETKSIHQKLDSARDKALVKALTRFDNAVAQLLVD